MAEKRSIYYPTPSLDGSPPDLSRSSSKSASTPNTIPHTPNAKKPKLSMDESDIGIQMGWYGLKYNHGAYKKVPDFKRHIQEIVLSDRGSTMRPESVKHYEDTLDVSGLFTPIHLSILSHVCAVRYEDVCSFDMLYSSRRNVEEDVLTPDSRRRTSGPTNIPFCIT